MNALAALLFATIFHLAQAQQATREPSSITSHATHKTSTSSYRPSHLHSTITVPFYTIVVSEVPISASVMALTNGTTTFSLFPSDIGRLTSLGISAATTLVIGPGTYSKDVSVGGDHPLSITQKCKVSASSVVCKEFSSLEDVYDIVAEPTYSKSEMHRVPITVVGGEGKLRAASKTLEGTAKATSQAGERVTGSVVSKTKASTSTPASTSTASRNETVTGPAVRKGEANMLGLAGAVGMVVLLV
jgi:hypothetical protein